MSNCEICLEQFDHSIHKPHILACPHTLCLSCINQLTNKKCPTCNEPFIKTNLNVALLKFIPESSYDCLKNDSIKAYIELNEIKKNLKISRQEKLSLYEAKIASIQQTITNKTKQAISILKNNEQQLNDECKILLDSIKGDLDSNRYELNAVLLIDESREKIEKDELNEYELTNLKSKISKIKEQSNKLSDKIKKYDNKFEFDQHKIVNESLLIGEIKSSHGFNKKGLDCKDFKKALEWYNKAIEFDSYYSPAYFNRGFLLYELEKEEEAISCLNKIIELDADRLDEVYSIKGYCLFNLGKYKDAIDCFDKAIELSPSVPSYYTDKGEALHELKKYEESIIFYEKAIQLYPNFSGAYNGKGNALFELKKYSEAIQSYDKALNIDPNLLDAINSKKNAIENLINLRNLKL